MAIEPFVSKPRDRPSDGRFGQDDS